MCDNILTQSKDGSWTERQTTDHQGGAHSEHQARGHQLGQGGQSLQRHAGRK